MTAAAGVARHRLPESSQLGDRKNFLPPAGSSQGPNLLCCRVRRALDLQSSSAGQGVPSRGSVSLFERMPSQVGQSPNARASDAAAGLPQRAPEEQLSSLDETSDWQQGSGPSGSKGRRGLPPLSRKRSEPLPPTGGRNMRHRCAAWNPTAAAAHTLARLQLSDDC